MEDERWVAQREKFKNVCSPPSAYLWNGTQIVTPFTAHDLTEILLLFISGSKASAIHSGNFELGFFFFFNRVPFSSHSRLQLGSV